MTDQTALVHASPTLPALADLRSMAEVFYKSGLFQDIKDEAQALVKILKGQELGLSPVASMHAFDVIQGRLFVRGQTCAALLNHCPYARFTPRTKDATQATIAFFRRDGGAWVELPAVTYTLEEAKQRGLTTKPEWKHSPSNMLYWRCLTRGTAHYFPELLAGLAVPEDPLPPVSDQQAQQTIAEVWGERVDLHSGEVQAPPAWSPAASAALDQQLEQDEGQEELPM